MPYSIREVFAALSKMAQEARRINVYTKRVFRTLPENFSSLDKEKLHPRQAFHIKRVEKILGGSIYVGDANPQVFTSPQGVTVFAVPRDWFLEMVEQGAFSLHGSVLKKMKEMGKVVADDEVWKEAHKRTLSLILSNTNNTFAKRAAHEYLSHLILGAAAHELLGGRTIIPKELRPHVESYKRAIKNLDRSTLEILASYYRHFEKAAKEMGFHKY